MKSKVRLCSVGPMIGRNPGFVTTQGERLSDRLGIEGYSTMAVSSSTNRYIRLIEIVETIVRRRKKIDILFMHVFGGPSFVVEDIASLLGRCFRHRIVMVLHGGAIPEFIARFPKWGRRVLGRADVLVTPSPYLARALLPYGFQASIIPNTIELSLYEYIHRTRLAPRLFWMRSFHPAYNPLMAVRVLAALRQVVPDATLVMAGQDKGYELEVRKLVRDLKLNAAVRFAGFLDMNAKVREGNAADIFINTNRIDNMPVGIVEAAAMGLPVVSTAVGGVPDLLADGETGLLVPDGDVVGMVNAILRLLNNPDLASRLSQNGRRIAERSAWESVRIQWTEVINGLSS